MTKRSHHVMPRTSRTAVRSASKPTARSPALKEKPFNLFESLPDSIVVCDQEGKTLWFNTAALKLFEVPPQAQDLATSFEQFLERCNPCDELQQPISVASWLITTKVEKEAEARSPEQTLILSLPSGHTVTVEVCCFPVCASHKQPAALAYLFHLIHARYHKALHLQRVHEALSRLLDAISHMPEHLDLVPSQDILLLSPLIIFVAQQLVDVIRHVLSVRRVSLFAYGAQDLQYFVAASGLTPQQEHYWRELSGCLPPLTFFDQTVFARLCANSHVIVTDDNQCRPLQFQPTSGTENLLLIPLFLDQRLAGTLSIVKADAHRPYTPQEIELVKAVAGQTALIIECLGCLQTQVKTQARALVQEEISRLSNDFLTLASHELLTPLTAILGNLQLAERRLETLKRQMRELGEPVSQKIEHAQRPLASACESACLQKRMIYDIIDDACIQTNQLHVYMSHCDLLTLLKDAIAKLQPCWPEHTITLLIPKLQGVPIRADAQRITKVINTYLAHALNHCPHDMPVTVTLQIEDATATVSVHSAGPGLSAEEQEHLWERFYRAKGSAVQHELDLSLGLGFYLCKAFIEHHGGRVGVHSTPGKGQTFWFTLPVLPAQ